LSCSLDFASGGLFLPSVIVASSSEFLIKTGEKSRLISRLRAYLGLAFWPTAGQYCFEQSAKSWHSRSYGSDEQ
jgi:hypothetical protein